MEATTTINRSMPEVCHLSSLDGMVIPLGNILGPVSVWFWKRNADPVMAEHAREALNFQISMTIYFGVLVLAAVACMPVLHPWIVNNMNQWTLNSSGQPLFMLVPVFVAAPSPVCSRIIEIWGCH